LVGGFFGKNPKKGKNFAFGGRAGVLAEIEWIFEEIRVSVVLNPGSPL
jgi:hypothetical protein